MSFLMKPTFSFGTVSSSLSAEPVCGKKKEFYKAIISDEDTS